MSPEPTEFRKDCDKLASHIHWKCPEDAYQGNKVFRQLFEACDRIDRLEGNARNTLYKIGEPKNSVKRAVDPVFALCVSAVYQKEEIDRLNAELKAKDKRIETLAQKLQSLFCRMEELAEIWDVPEAETLTEWRKEIEQTLKGE